MSIAEIALSPIRKESEFASRHCRGLVLPCSSESILIYLNDSESVTPMRVLESDSIASVKVRIQSCKGFMVKKQKLVLGGRELARNDSPIKEYGIRGGNILHVVLRLSDLLLITVITICGEEFEFNVDRHRNVLYLKQCIAKEGKAFINLKDQELFCNGKKLNDQSLIDDISKNNDAVVHLLVHKSAKVRAKPVEKDFELSVVASISNESSNETPEDTKNLQSVITKPPSRNFWLEPIIANPTVKLPTFIWNMINSTIHGLEKGYEPIRSSEGTGGTYLMQDSVEQEFVSVFKPIDEEPMAINNPRGLPLSSNGEGLKKGTRVGEGALREVAAYILDHPRSGPRTLSGEMTGFASVPPTIMIECLHKGFSHPEGYDGSLKNAKIGSLQMFMKNNGSCEDIGPGAFPVEEVHKISVFDIRMANADRHGGNILCSKREDGQTMLIPIDHGYCLPHNFEDCTFDWLYWPQAQKPYSVDTINYIHSLDAEQDIHLLKFYGWDIPHECGRVLRISTMLLKKGVKRGLTPFIIGSIMCRETVNKESLIEEMVREAEESLLPGVSEAAFLEAISQIMDSRLDKLGN